MIHVITGSSSKLFEHKRICFTLQSHHQCSFHYQCHCHWFTFFFTFLDVRKTTLALAGAARPPLFLDRASRPNARRLSPAPLPVAITVFRRTAARTYRHISGSAVVASLADLVSPAFFRLSPVSHRRVRMNHRYELSAHGFTSQQVWFPSSTSLSWGAISPARLVTASHNAYISSKVDFS